MGLSTLLCSLLLVCFAIFHVYLLLPTFRIFHLCSSGCSLLSSLLLYPSFLCGSCNTGDLGSIPGLGRSPGEGIGYPFQYSGLENSMDCIVHRVPKSQTDRATFTFTFSPDQLITPKSVQILFPAHTYTMLLKYLSPLCASQQNLGLSPYILRAWCLSWILAQGDFRLVQLSESSPVILTY